MDFAEVENGEVFVHLVGSEDVVRYGLGPEAYDAVAVAQEHDDGVSVPIRLLGKTERGGDPG